MDVVETVKTRDDRLMEQYGSGGGAENTVKAELIGFAEFIVESVKTRGGKDEAD